MNSNVFNKIPERKPLSFLRTALVMAALFPSWHVVGTFLFHVPESRASEGIQGFSKSTARPFPSMPLDFVATAYCEDGITKSGALTKPGIVAGDPRVLPLGSWIHVEAPGYSGIYQVMDTGRLIKGRIIDLFIPSWDGAIEFGRRKVTVTVLKYAAFKRGATLLSN